MSHDQDLSGDKDAVMDEVRLIEASEWFLRLREDAVTNEVIADWLAWCNGDSENARAYEQIRETWSLARDAGVREWPSAAQIESDEYAGDISIVKWKQLQREREPRASLELARASRTRTYAFGLAASLVLAVATWSYIQYWSARPPAQTYATERAAKREIRLPDGSTAALGGASAIRVIYQDGRRDIALESGEAYFDVKPDKARPFVVTAREVRVTAVGTAFTVRTDDVRTVVAVTDGIVEVAETGVLRGIVHEPIRARAGEQITYDSEQHAATKQPSDDAIALGWQAGVLSYVDEPLRSVVARVNRNSTSEILLTDSALGELRFTGTVHEDQIQEWALSLERVFPVRVMVGGDGRVAIGPR